MPHPAPSVPQEAYLSPPGECVFGLNTDHRMRGHTVAAPSALLPLDGSK